MRIQVPSSLAGSSIRSSAPRRSVRLLPRQRGHDPRRTPRVPSSEWSDRRRTSCAVYQVAASCLSLLTLSALAANLSPAEWLRAHPVEMDCHFESTCESCTFFVTTIEFRPTIERQRDNAAAKRQVAREQIVDGLHGRLSRLDGEAS